ncbi:MAG: CCC motif membrane protein [Croceivirga sp.]
MNQQSLPGASTTLTMGILSIVGSLVCCGPFAIIFSIIGLVKAKSAEKLYHEQPELYSDYSNVKTGRILSYIGLALSLIMLIFTILYFGVIFAFLMNAGEFQ